MYNRNYGGFDYVRIHSELLTSVPNRKNTNLKPVTDGYTRPLPTIMKKTLLILLIFNIQIVSSQNEELFNRLNAIHNSGTTFYNVDGIDFTSQTISSEFNDKNLKKAYRKYKIKKNDIKETDRELNFENYKIVKREQFENDLSSISVNYFVKNNDNRISIFWFGYYNESNPEFERKIIELNYYRLKAKDLEPTVSRLKIPLS